MLYILSLVYIWVCAIFWFYQREVSTRPVTKTQIHDLTILCCICVFSNFANFEDGKGTQTAELTWWISSSNPWKIYLDRIQNWYHGWSWHQMVMLASTAHSLTLVVKSWKTRPLRLRCVLRIKPLIIEARRLARNVEVDLPYVLHSFCITHKSLYLTLMHEKHRLGQEQSLSFQKSLNDREAKY